MRLFQYYSLLLLLIGSRLSSAAEFTAQPWHGASYHLYLAGQILPGDEIKFQNLVLSLIRQGHLVSAIHLGSIGGDTLAAMAIGEQIRLLEIQTLAPGRFVNAKNAKEFRNGCAYGSLDRQTWSSTPVCECASACFLVWAAGVDRYGNVVGIHHPYYDPKIYAGLPSAQAQQLYEAMMPATNKYLKDMNVPEPIVNRLWMTNSIDIYYLSVADIQSMSNGAPWMSQYILDRCGQLPNGNIYLNANRAKYVNCAGEIWEEVERKASQKYLNKFGGWREKVPPTVPAVLSDALFADPWKPVAKH